MTRFEYKILPALGGTDGRGGMPPAGAGDEPADRSRSAGASATGWELVGRKEVPVERRRWLILRQSASEEFLVFRRAIAEPERVVQPAPEGSPESAIRPRRVLRNCFPDLGLSDPGFRRTRLRARRS
ncbi:MAG: hypothetical protein JSR87_04640 [Proteobacteria bacterium]|nr:hypothetical protein [Pseudomonadota bacterium]MBS0574303.1 hypothetical protein [Pseudomonadota bacterium]